MSLKKTKIVNILDSITVFSIYIVAFQLPIAKAAIEIFSTLAIVCFIIRKILQREGLERSVINLPIFAYLAICFLSIFISNNLGISTRTFFGKILQDVMFLFIVAETLNTEERLKIFIYIFISSSLLLGIDGIYQFFTHKDFIRNRPYFGIPRIHATFSSANDYGCYLAALLPFSVAVFFEALRRKIKSKYFFIVVFILLFICLMLTVSRGAWFAFLGSILLMSIWVKAIWIIMAVIGIVLLVLNQSFFPYLRERLSNFFVFSDQSSGDRRMMWEAAFKMFLSKPWLGVGIGTFMFNFKNFVSKDYPFTTPYAHNCYLQIASEIGIIGLLAFLLILGAFFYKNIKTLNLRSNNYSWYILLATTASVLGYCVQMVVDTIFYSLDLGILFWLLLGLGIAASRLTIGKTKNIN
ncbi:MAG: O-antigen ligase family protein [Candidatus Omnitrophica bacterium]|nr:O-antigen ligase family protein [Candidatus Omnitrophota bacterium]